MSPLLFAAEENPRQHWNNTKNRRGAATGGHALSDKKFNAYSSMPFRGESAEMISTRRRPEDSSDFTDTLSIVSFSVCQ